MQRALELAIRGQGYVEPNPMVGCVIVRDGRIVGRGYHRRFGGPHAEVFALREAGRRAAGATVYVTLEPCGHVGKTPPCADALIAAKVGRVVAGMRDPNPLVAGRGLRKLRAAGIAVQTGLQRGEAAALNAPFVTFHRARRPHVILKWAQSLDGKIATRSGDSQWITSAASRRQGHALRARVDAVIVGVGTVLADDPMLTARMVKPRRVATRIVLDRRLRTPLAAQVVRTASAREPTLIVGARGAAPLRKQRALERAGCEVILLPANRQGIRLDALLGALWRRAMTNVLVEGGGRVLGAFLGSGLGDEAHVFVAPRLIGGEVVAEPLRHIGPERMADVPKVRVEAVRQSGPDMWYNLRFG